MNVSAFLGKKNLIANNLRAKRESLGLSQRELAIKIQIMGVDLNQQDVSKIENNNRNVTDYELVCLCLALDTDIMYMLKGCYEFMESF